MERVQYKLSPILKWTGGKSRAFKHLKMNLPQVLLDGKINNYYEPFLGGGAMFLNLIQNVKFSKCVLSDINEDLMLFYNVVKNNPKELISLVENELNAYIKISDKEKREDFYYKIREIYNNERSTIDYNNYSNYYIHRASQLLFLNKTGFGGRYRQNTDGEFNVPCSGEKPSILKKENILNFSAILKCKNIYLMQSDYKKICNEISGNNSFVYFDPPYEGTVSDYYKIPFTHEDHIRLSEIYRELHKKNVFLMMNNSSQTGKYYDGFTIKRINSQGTVARKPSDRREIEELIITNY